MNYLSPNESGKSVNYLTSQEKERLLLLLRQRQSTNPVDWIQTHFYIPETNAAIILEPYQRAVITEALAKDNGLFRYSFVLWSDLKKSAKSTIAGAMALYLAWHTGWESVRIVGNDLKQADSRTFFYIERAIRLNPFLMSQCKIKNYEITLPNYTVISAVPVDPKGEAGGGDLATVFTEMWAMKNKASQMMWSETTLSPLKFGKSLRIGESYAGFKGDSPILEPLYEQGVQNGQPLDVGIPGLELYRNDRLLCLWNTKPRCRWQTEDYYKQEALALTPSEFDRLHRNQWAESNEAFIPIEWWDACEVNALPDMRARQGVVLGVDAAVDSDYFALVMVSTQGGKYQVRYCNVWKPPKDGKIDLKEPAAEILRLSKLYNVECVAYDPMHMQYMAQLLGDNLHWYEVNQGAARLVCDKYLYDVIRERQIEHDGSYPELREHLTNADKKPEDSRLRIIKRVAGKHIDAVIALSMAIERASAYNL